MGVSGGILQPSWPERLADLLPVLLVWLDREGRIVRVNPFFAAFTGFTVEEVVGLDWFETFVPPRERHRVRAVHAATLTDISTSGTLNAIVRRDGSEADIEWQNRALHAEDGAFEGCLAFGVDATERVRARRALEHSEAMLAEAQRIAHIGSWELDLRTMQARWSAETYRILEVDPGTSDLFEQFVARIHPDDRPGGVARFEAAVTSGAPVDELARLLMPDGRIKWVRQRAGLMNVDLDERGQPTRMVGTLEDVTERVLGEQAITAERTLLRSTIEVFPGFAGVYTKDGALVSANSAARRLSGRTDDRTAPWALPGWPTAETGASLREGFTRALTEGGARFEIRVGSLEIEAAFEPIRDTDGEITHVAAFGLDVTPRNRALARAQASEARLIEAQRIARVGSWELDLSTNVLRWSDEVFRIFEIDPRSFAASYEAFLATIHPEDRPRVDDAYQRSLRERRPYEVGHRLLMPDGRVKHVHERGEHAFDAAGTPVRSVGTVHDVTLLVDAEERLRRVLDAMAPFVAVLDLEGRFVEVNRAPLELVGQDRDAVLGTVVWERPTWQVNQAAVATLREGVRRAAAGEVFRADLTSLASDGRAFTVDATFCPARDCNGRIVQIIASAVDITERKRMEDELLVHSRVLVSMAEGVNFVGMDGRVRFTSPAFDAMFGYAAGELVGQHVSVLNDATAEENAAIIDGILEHMARGALWQGEFKNRKKDGTVFYSHARITTVEGTTERLYVTVQEDITERRAARLALERSERRLAEAHRLAHIGAWERDLRTGTGWWSEELYRIFEAPRDEPRVFDTFLSRVHPEDRAVVEAAVPTAMIAGWWEGDFRILRPNGEVRHLHSVAEVTFEGARPVVIAGTHQDVTPQREAEELIRRTSTLLSSVVDSSTDWIFVKDAAYRFLLTNRAMASGFAVEPKDMLGRLDVEFVGPIADRGDDEWRLESLHASDDRVLAGETVHLPAVPVTLATGQQRVFDTVKLPLRDQLGRIYGVLGYCRDVTDARRAAKEQARSLEEKETLLREIHHRVKNNLQILSSLLHFQAKKARTADQLAVFSEARSRILAMILVHEKLYQSQELSRVAFGDYVRSLTQVLAASFVGGVKVRVSVDTDDLRLPLEVALPTGMILCELLTNVFKYAYPDATMGAARVVARREGDTVRLRVEDDGVGLPVDLDPSTVTSFGFHLVQNLVEQLDGRLSFGPGAIGRGAHVEVTFPLRTPTLWPDR